MTTIPTGASTMPNDFARERRRLIDDPALTGVAFGRALSDLVDAWVAEMLGDEPGVAAVAVGGYGRRELCPGSDLDIVLLHAGRRDVAEVANRIWYPIWDARLRLDHSVRTPKEALAVAADDLRATLGLLDGRHIAGDPSLTERVLPKVRERWTKHARASLDALGEAARERHARAGDLAYLLEPDLKDSAGGFRDLSLIRHVLEMVPELRLEDPAGAAAAHATILDARVALHRVTDSGTDRLLLDHQDAVATNLGYLDADALMADLAAAGRAVAWTLDDLHRRALARVAPTRRARRRGPDEEVLDRDLVLRDDEVVILDPMTADDSIVFRAAAASAYSGRPIERASLAALGAHRGAAATGAAPWTPATLNAFISLLGSGSAVVPVWESLDHHGLLAPFLPEWDRVRCRPQRNAFHRYTVDRHLLAAAAEASRLTRTVERPDLLLLAAFLHDIGKGYPGDHTDAGVEVLAPICRRMGITEADLAILTTLVREHLLLASAATGRDLADPATAAWVASRVGDVEVLDLLAALTEADSLATGETAWSRWKAELLAVLVDRTRAVLAGEAPPTAAAVVEPVDPAIVARAAEGAVVTPVDDRVVVVTRDEPGLLARVVGLLTLHGQSIRGASARSTEDGMAVDVFELDAVLADPPDWTAFEAELRARPSADDLARRLAARARTYRARPTAARTAPATVLVHDDASATATVVEVRAPDAVGLLHRITHEFERAGLDIVHAKVTTLGHEVVDTFYVRGVGGGKLDPAAVDVLVAALSGVLAAGGPGESDRP